MTNLNNRFLFKKVSLVFARLLAICVLFLFASCSPEYSGKEPPKVINGEIDLTGWDFEKDGPVELKGDWLFAWQNFVEPASWPELRKQMDHTIALPGRWLDTAHPEKPGETLPGMGGYASYALRIKGLEKESFDMMVDMIFSGETFVLKNNGQVIARAEDGRPATTASLEVPKQETTSFLRVSSGLSQENDKDEPYSYLVLIHNSCFHHINGGVRALEVSQMDSMVYKHAVIQNQRAMMFGILLIIGIYHLIIFVLRPSDKSILFFSLLCLAVALRQFVSGVAQFQGLNETLQAYIVITRLGYSSLVLIFWVFVHYLKYLLPSYWYNQFARFLILPAMLLQVFTLFADVTLFVSFLDYYLLYMTICLLVMAIHLLVRLLKRDQGSGWVFSMYLLILFGTLNDILFARGLINSVYVGPYTLISFIVMQAGFLAQRLSKSSRQTRALAQRLSKQLVEKKELLQSNEELAAQKEKYSKLVSDLSVEFAQAGVDLEASKAEQKQIAKELADASQQLIQADKLSSLGAMVSGIAHDINNPLNFIETARFQEQEKHDQLKEHLLDLIPEGEDGKAFKDDLLERFARLDKLNEQIRTGVQRVTEISKSMRNASRADTEIAPDVNLVEVIEESIIITGNKVKVFELQKNLPDGIALADCNRSQIGQVIMNFLSNAADELSEYKVAYPDHRGIIAIELTLNKKDQQESETAKVRISVTDNGGGIPLEDREKVLNAFYTTKAVGVGTGLGLAICGKIADDHNGFIEISDGFDNGNGGKGASFTIEFDG